MIQSSEQFANSALTVYLRGILVVTGPDQFPLTSNKHNMKSRKNQTRVTSSKKPRKHRGRSNTGRGASAPATPSSVSAQPPSLQPSQTGPPLPQAQNTETSQTVWPQQTMPSAFLRLPADILALVVPHLDPLDAIHLSRVNTSVRKVMIHRSAGPMWRACIKNTGLPACPPEISELRYVHVLYLGVCSYCGTNEQRGPDTYLFVRLCARCCKRQLVDWRTIEPAEVQQLVLASEKSCTSKERPTGLKHSLKREVRAVKVRLDGLKSSGDAAALGEWVKTRKKELERRREHTKLVAEFTDTVRWIKMDNLKSNWDDQPSVGSILSCMNY
ncbi:hypothetical protein FRC08_004671 [Ceratobasidium sp. 394]|nr:hypothetical protein FRC08_004671 [Ceratobasidium sp. 394]